MSPTRITVIALAVLLSAPLINSTPLQGNPASQQANAKSFKDILGPVPFVLQDIVNNLKDPQKKPDDNLSG